MSDENRKHQHTPNLLHHQAGSALVVSGYIVVCVVHRVGVNGEPGDEMCSLKWPSFSPVEDSNWLVDSIVEVQLDHVCVQI